MNIFEKLTQYTENIIETVSPEHFMYIFIWGIVWISFYNFIGNIYIAIENKIWLVKDYEKLIATYLNTYDTDNNKEKELISKAKKHEEIRIRYLEKRKAIKQKIKSLFNKGKK